MASIIERGANGSVTYKSHRHYDVPNIDVLTLLLGKLNRKQPGVRDMRERRQNTALISPPRFAVYRGQG